VKDFCKNVENGNRVIGFIQIKKSYICEFTFKFSFLTNFSNWNVEANRFFMIAKTKLFRSNKIMFKSMFRDSIWDYFWKNFKTDINKRETSIIITIRKIAFLWNRNNRCRVPFIRKRTFPNFVKNNLKAFTSRRKFFF